jgi:hypothetical protein
VARSGNGGGQSAAAANSNGGRNNQRIKIIAWHDWRGLIERK